MNPDDQQQRRLHRAEQGRVDPKINEFLRISLLKLELAERDAGADHVIGQQEWDREAEDKLGRLVSNGTGAARKGSRSRGSYGSAAKRRGSQRLAAVARSAFGQRGRSPSRQSKCCRARDWRNAASHRHKARARLRARSGEGWALGFHLRHRGKVIKRRSLRKCTKPGPVTIRSHQNVLQHDDGNDGKSETIAVERP